MKLQELTVIIAQQDPIRANAVGKMAEYITQRFRPAFPSKEQAQAVNAYLDRICPPSNYPITETECEHRRIAAQQLVIDSIQVLNHDELDKLSDVLDHIAYDRDYYMPERWIKRSMPTHFTTVIIHPIWGENRLKTA